MFLICQNALRISGCYNAFQMRFDELSSSKGNKGDLTINTKTIYFFDINDGELSQKQYIQIFKYIKANVQQL